MSVSPFLRNLAVLAVIAAAIVVFNQETALITVGVILRIVFFIAIALVAYSLWRDFGRREIATWPTRAVWVFYGGLVLLVADVGWWMLSYDISGRNALAFFIVAAVSVYAMVRTWRSQRY
jgi:hypothetical protein